MDKNLIQHISTKLSSYPAQVFLVENNDQFFFRDDVIAAFATFGVEVCKGTPWEQRLAYELREEDGFLLLLSNNNTNYLEDIINNSVSIKLNLSDFLPGYHIPSIKNLDLKLINKLFSKKLYFPLNRKDTLLEIEKVKHQSTSITTLDVNDFTIKLQDLLSNEPINWSVVCREIASGLRLSIGTYQFNDVFLLANQINTRFQLHLESSFKQIKNSSAIKKPRIVSRILDYLHFNFTDKRIALIVVDGMAYWQYELIREGLSDIVKEEVIYSWLPSITQLSRQAIFRGSNPVADYKQGPVNEEKLWRSYWKSKGIQDFQIDYQHEKNDLTNIETINKLAIVYKELDDKMHSSTDYTDLLALTRHWIARSNIIQTIKELKEKGFIVFLTADHGNIQAKGWRGLQGREKLGTNKSGSRGERHIEYSEEWLASEFSANNPEIMDVVTKADNAMYFNSDLSFSNKESLVTHGGSHLLEVLIPFIEI